MANPRPLSAIDCELRQTLTLQRDTDQQLAALRAEIAHLQQAEYQLECATDAHRRRIDRLLDERQAARA